MPVAGTGARRRRRRRCIVYSDLHYYGSIKRYAICNDYTLCPIVQLFELLGLWEWLPLWTNCLKKARDVFWSVMKLTHRIKPLTVIRFVQRTFISSQQRTLFGHILPPNKVLQGECLGPYYVYSYLHMIQNYKFVLLMSYWTLV